MNRINLTTSLVLGLISWLVYDRVQEREAPPMPQPLAQAVPTITLSGEAPPHHERFQKTVSWEFMESPLTKVAAFIGKDLDVPVKIDEKALMDAAISTDTLITFHVKGVNAHSALDLILRDHALGSVWWKDCLLITTQEQLDTNPDFRPTRLYPVADLVRFSDDGKEVRDYDSLIDAIVSVVRPETWKEQGTGEGTIEPVDVSCTLIVCQTEDVHAEIAQILRVLREARRMQGMSGPPELVKQPMMGGGFSGSMGFGGGGAGSGGGLGGGLGGGVF